MTAPTSPAPALTAAMLPAQQERAAHASPAPFDPLPLPPPGWGPPQARLAVREAALVLPSLAAGAQLVRALSTVVFRIGSMAVKVHAPGTDPAHVSRVHTALRDSPVAVTATGAPIVTSHGVVTVTPWYDAGVPATWSEVGEALRALHDLPAAASLPPWTPLRRLPAQLEHLPETQARLLAEARQRVLERISALVPALASGVLHGDVSPDNVLRTPDGPRWIDLDFVCSGLREYDLSAVVRRYAAGELSDADYRGFVAGYGVDLRGWPGLCVLDASCLLSGIGFRLWIDRCAGRPSAWLPEALARVSAVPAAR